MSDQEIQPCVMCGQQHEQMLMLECMHDPCINCAAIHLCSKSPVPTSYICPKCEEETELDGSSVLELQKVYAQLKGKKKYDYRRGQGSISDLDNNNTTNKYDKSNLYEKSNASSKKNLRPTKEPQHRQNSYEPTYQQTYSPSFEPAISSHSHAHSYTPISQPSYPSNPYHNVVVRKNQQSFYMCQAHPEQELSYFCFNCNMPICPQCAIHGTHREHQVQTTRKAIKSIKNSLQKCHEMLGGEVSNIVAILDQYRNRHKEYQNQVQREKGNIKDTFNQLRNILNQKQKEFQRAVDSVHEWNGNIYKTVSVSFDKLIEQNTAAKKNIELTLKKDDLGVLQQFNKKQNEANAAIEASRNKKYNPDLEGLKEVDYGLFRDEVDQLSGILSALKLTVQSKRK